MSAAEQCSVEPCITKYCRVFSAKWNLSGVAIVGVGEAGPYNPPEPSPPEPTALSYVTVNVTADNRMTK